MVIFFFLFIIVPPSNSDLSCYKIFSFFHPFSFYFHMVAWVLRWGCTSPSKEQLISKIFSQLFRFSSSEYTAESSIARYGSSNFIRYIHTQQNITGSKYELDINQKTTGLLKGCGTYGDPYIIEDAHQLSSLAAYIQDPGSVSKFQVIFNSKVLEKQTQTAEGYHLLNGANSDTIGTDITYTWENGAWKSENGDAADTEKATNYLLNAYYKIDKDITLSAERFGG